MGAWEPRLPWFDPARYALASSTLGPARRAPHPHTHTPLQRGAGLTAVGCEIWCLPPPCMQLLQLRRRVHRVRRKQVHCLPQWLYCGQRRRFVSWGVGSARDAPSQLNHPLLRAGAPYAAPNSRMGAPNAAPRRGAPPATRAGAWCGTRARGTALALAPSCPHATGSVIKARKGSSAAPLPSWACFLAS